MLSSRPYIEIIADTDRLGNPCFRAVSAILLISCPTGRLLEMTSQGVSLNSLAKQIDLINSLYQPNTAVDYSIRYISRPRKVSNTGGTVETCIFCRCTASTGEEAGRLVEDQAGQLLVQLCATYPNHVWQLVKNEEEFRQVMAPIDWEKARVAEIRRREELVVLDSIRPVRKLGFNGGSAKANPDQGNPLYFVHSFLPHPGQLERLLRMILLTPQNITLTVTLSSTILEATEEQALLDEISSSEGFRETTTTNVQRIQEHRASMLCNSLMNQLLSLQDSPFYMTILLASTEKIPATLVEGAGLAISASIGEGLHSVYTDPAFIQMGGYDTVFPATKEEKAVARKNLATLGQTPWGKTLAPDALARLRYLVNGHEAACAFRFPEDNGDGLPGLKTHTERSRPIPPELISRVEKLDPSQTLLLGTNTYMGMTNDVRIPFKERLTHMYVVGQTGTGKSTLLKTMLLSDMQAGRGCALIDPHGDLYEEMLALIPPERVNDVVLIDPSDTAFPIGMNLLEANNWEEKHFVVREMQAIMKRLIEDQYQRTVGDYAGPSFFHHMQMNMLLTMSDPDNPGTLLDFYEIYQTKDYWKRWIPLKVEDEHLKIWIDTTLKNNNYSQPGSGGYISTGDYYSSKFMDFVFDPRLRCIFGQPKSTFNLQEIMNGGKILLVNLAKGLLGEANSRFLGLILMAKIQAEAMKRATIPAAKRRPFFLYVDEFQSLATENFTILLSEARKFGMGLVLANQFLSQITDPRIVQAIFGNVGSFLSFRLGREDASHVEPQFLPYFDQMDLVNMPNWQVVMRTTVEGTGLHPFSLRTILPRMEPDPKIARQVRTLSRVHYGQPRAEVEKRIAASLSNAVPVDTDPLKLEF